MNKTKRWLLGLTLVVVILTTLVGAYAQLPAKPIQPEAMLLEPWEISHKPIIIETTLSNNGGGSRINYCEGERLIEGTYDLCKDYKITFGKEWNWLKWRWDYYTYIQTTNHKVFMKHEGIRVLDNYRFNIKLISFEKGIVEIVEL